MATDAVMIVLSIFLLIGVGMALTWAGWIDAGGAKLLARLTVNVGMVGLVIHNMLTQFTRQSLASSLNGILLSYISIALTMALGWAAALLFRVAKDHRGLFTCMFGFSNTIFIGLPVVVALFGEQVAPYVLIYYIANTCMFWSLGNFLLAKDGGQKGRMNIKKLLPAPLLAFLAGVVMVLLNLTLPDFLLSTCKYLGNMVTPVSLIYTGYIIMGMLRSGHVRWQKGYGAILAGRFILSPILLLACAWLTPVPQLMRDALLVQSAMPVMAQATIVAGERGADSSYAAGGVALSTLLSLAVLPALTAILPYIP